MITYLLIIFLFFTITFGYASLTFDIDMLRQYLLNISEYLIHMNADTSHAGKRGLFLSTSRQPTQTVTITLSVSQVNSSQSSVQSSSLDIHPIIVWFVMMINFVILEKWFREDFLSLFSRLKHTHTQFWIWINFWTIFFVTSKTVSTQLKKNISVVILSKNRPFNRHASYSFVGPLFKKWQFRFFSKNLSIILWVVKFEEKKLIILLLYQTQNATSNFNISLFFYWLSSLIDEEDILVLDQTPYLQTACHTQSASFRSYQNWHLYF